MCVRVSKYVYVCVCVMLVGTLSCKKKSVLLKVFFFFFFFSSISLLRDAQGFQRCDDFNTRVGVPLHIAMFFLSVRHQPMNYKLLRCSSKDAALPPVSLHFLPRPRKSPPPPPFVFGATLMELCVVCGGGFTTVRPISLHGSRKRTPATTTTSTATSATKPQRNKETNEREEGEDSDGGEGLPSARSVCVFVSETCLSVRNGTYFIPRLLE